MHVVNLNKQQREAVETTEGSVLILAGAGSGKTAVLVERIEYMIEQKSIPAEQILSITFTNKAAKELKERINKKIGAQDSKRIWASNFHSMCVRILKAHANKSLKIQDNRFTIYDKAESLDVIKEIIKEMGFSKEEVVPKNIQYAISMLKNEMVDIETYINEKPMNQFIDWGKASKLMNTVVLESEKDTFKSLFKKYQERLYHYNAVDFDDLIMHTIDLFIQKPEVLSHYQNKLQYVQVDEYQDTNRSQYTLVKMLTNKHKNLCVVGDDSQSIYKFRGADIRNILNFHKDYPNAKTIKLEQNYRSTDKILRAANQVIANNIEQFKKELFTLRKNGEGITSEQFSDEYNEARYVSDEIEDRIRYKKYNYGDIAILSRTNSQSRVFEQTFMRYSIPYKIVGGTKFFDRKEIKDLVAYIKFLYNPNDVASFRRIVNFPRRGIGAKTMTNIVSQANQVGLSKVLDDIKNIKLSGKARTGIESLVNITQETRKNMDTTRADHLIKQFIKDIGFLEALSDLKEDDEKTRDRKHNVSQLVNMAADMVYKGDGLTLEDFVDQISLYSDTDEIEDENQVKMMTVHASKGLEFPIVFGVGMEEGIFPHDRSIAEGDIEEERRLMYVLMTRAKDKLYLTNCSTRRVFGDIKEFENSRFLEEFDFNLLA